MKSNILIASFVLLLFTCQKSDVGNIQFSHKSQDKLGVLIDTPVFLYSKLLDTSITKNVRIVEYKFKVSDVLETGSKLGDIAINRGGYVSRDNTKSIIANITKTAVSEDSSILQTCFNLTNTLMLRVPNRHLDSTLKDISQTIEFLDFRYLKGNDAAMEALASNESIETNSNKEYRNKVLGQSTGKSKEELEQLEDYKKAFSAVIISFYQNPVCNRETIYREKPILEYQPSFKARLNTDFNESLSLFETIILCFVRYWPILLFIIIVMAIAMLYRDSSSPV